MASLGRTETPISGHAESMQYHDTIDAITMHARREFMLEVDCVRQWQARDSGGGGTRTVGIWRTRAGCGFTQV